LAFDIWALPFSRTDAKAAGAAFPIGQNARGATVAIDGTLAYVDTSLAAQERLIWVNRDGEETGEIGLVEGAITGPGLALSPDGRRVAGSSSAGSQHDFWIWQMEVGVRTRLSSGPARDIIPVWSPNGERVAFSSFRSNNWDVMLRHADGSGDATVLMDSPRDEYVSDWSKDGNCILFVVDERETKNDVWYLKRNGEGGAWQAHPFLQTPFHETVPKLSPDGRYVVYTSDDSGRSEVYVQPFPKGGQRAIVSRAGGIQPRWSGDGREIFYVDRGTVMSVPVSTSPSLSLGSAKRLFFHRSISTFPVPQYDVSADGLHFVVAELVGEPSIRIVQSWFEEFKK
jgi:Tol biopolymer transport system component